MSDPYYSNVALLMHMEGASVASFVDTSPSPATLTVAGAPTADTTNKKFGSSSLNISNNTSHIGVQKAVDLTGSYTIEAFVCSGGATVVDGNCIIATNGNVYPGRVTIDFLCPTSTTMQLRVLTANNAIAFTSSSATITPGEFVHIEYDNDTTANTFKMFIGGVLVGSRAAVPLLSLSNFSVADCSSAWAEAPFQIDELRITEGVARNSSNFTPPSAAFPDAGLGSTLTFSGNSPSPTLSASIKEVVKLSALLVAPSPALSSRFGGYISASAPKGTLNANILAGRTLSFAGEAPKALLTSRSGLVANLESPSPSLVAAATATSLLSATLTAPIGILTAQGTVSGTLSATLSPKIGTIQAYTGAVAKLTAPSSPILSALVTAGGVMRVTVMAPLFKLSASATRRNNLGASLVAPMGFLRTGAVVNVAPPMAQLTAIGSAVVTVNYEAYALNLKHNTDTPDELTRYTNFPFDRIVRYQNSYYGMNSTGLYLLEGTTDFAEPTPTPIPWSWKTAMTDFGTTQLQTIRYAYFGGRMAPAATIAIHFGDTASESYAYSTPRDTSAQNYRQEFGRGIQSRYYAFSGQGEGELSLDSINFIIAKSARKV